MMTDAGMRLGRDLPANLTKCRLLAQADARDRAGWPKRLGLPGTGGEGFVTSALERRETKSKDAGGTADFHSDMKINHNSALESCLS